MGGTKLTISQSVVNSTRDLQCDGVQLCLPTVCLNDAVATLGAWLLLEWNDFYTWIINSQVD